MCLDTSPRSVFCITGRNFPSYKNKVEPKCLHLSLNLTSLSLCLRLNAVFLVELIDTTACRSSFLLTGVERMALRANLYVDLFLGGTGNELVAAVAGNLSLIISWMDSFSHDFHLFTFSLI